MTLLGYSLGDGFGIESTVSGRSYTNAVQQGENIESVILWGDTTVLCGLIINELVSNSVKHAFSGDHTGSFEVSVSRDKTGACQLLVHDDGVGFPPEQFLDNKESLGLRLVQNLVERLGGTVEYRNDQGG